MKLKEKISRKIIKSFDRYLRCFLMQKSRDSSTHANDNDSKRDKLKLCLHMLTLQGIYICSKLYIIFIRERKG